MGEIATSDRQITLFYSSKSVRAKQTLAYAKAEGIPIQEIDILKTRLTGTQIADRLHMELKIWSMKNIFLMLQVLNTMISQMMIG